MEYFKTSHKGPEKKGHNNKMDNSHNFLEKVTTIEDQQKTLFGKAQIKKQFRMNDNYTHILSMFALNPDFKFTRNKIYTLISIPMHLNTISNFIKYAETNYLIKRCVVIDGPTINNILVFVKLPATFLDGNRVPDIRATYYQITELGKRVYALNNSQNV